MASAGADAHLAGNQCLAAAKRTPLGLRRRPFAAVGIRGSGCQPCGLGMPCGREADAFRGFRAVGICGSRFGAGARGESCGREADAFRGFARSESAGADSDLARANGLEALSRRAPHRAARRYDRHGWRLAHDTAARARVRLQADGRDRHGHRARCDLQVVRRGPAPAAGSRSRTSHGVDAARLGAVFAGWSNARLVVEAGIRRRVRGRGQGDPGRGPGRLRYRVRRQGVPALQGEQPAVHPQTA